MKKILSLFAVTALTSLPALAQTSPNVRFNSLNAMVQYTPLSTNVSAMVTGNTAAGESYAGDFFYNSASSAATNTYSVFKPASTTGRWIRRNEAAWNQFTAAVAADSSTYAFSMRRNLETNVFNLGADNNNVYLQSQASYALHLNNIGNATVLNATGGNVGIRQSTFGTDAVGVLAFGNGTAPSASPADAVQVWSADITAGNAALHVRGEDGSVAAIGDGGLLFTGAQSVSTTTGNLSLSTAGGNGNVALTFNGTGGLTVGGGAALRALYSAAGELDFPSISANGVTNLTITVTGAGTNSAVSVSRADGAATAGITYNAYVDATNSVTIRAANPTVNAIDPATGSYRVVVFQY